MMGGNIVINKYEEQHYSIVFNKSTGLFIRVEENGFEEPFWAKSGPELIDISITNYCERGCKFCYRNSNTKGKHMDLQDYIKIIQQAKEIGILQVALGGGNPNQHPNFIEILKETVNHGIVPSYTTNGQGLSDDILEATKLYCGAMAISAYNPYESYLSELVDYVSTFKIKTNIHFLLNRNTIEKAISWLKEPPLFFDKINAIIFLNYKPINSSDESLLNRSQFIKDFFESVKNNKTHLKIGFDSCSISGILKYMNVNKIFYESCEAARFSAFISEDLKMYPCSFMINTDFYGDLKKNAISEIWKENRFFIEHRDKILNNECRSCSLENDCKGGCTFMNSINLCKSNF